MAKISTLHINNFKFFGNVEEKDALKVDSKHILIYGENGSGKSSIYWALYTLLEAAQKSNDAEVMKYFDKSHDRSLVNLNATPIAPTASDWNSFITAELDNGSIYRISIGEPNLRDNGDARNSNLASDFLNYRFAYKIHDVRHGEDNNLFDLFLKDVFPYVQAQQEFSVKGKVTRKLDQVWSYLAEGMPRAAGGRRVQYRSGPGRLYKRQAENFNIEVKRILADVGAFGNEILQESLGYPNINFTVSYEDIKFNYYGDALLPKIKLAIPQYDGFTNAINYLQSFLNEAKLTAIAIAMRIAILTGRLSEAELKLLVLDDLLISLDMSNRRKVLDLLLTQYAPTYQLFILTHDRSFFEFAEKKIRVEYGQKESWGFVEMYQDTSQPIPRPYIAKKKSNLKRAEDYFKEYDYPACGLYLRRDCEKLLEELLPDKFKFVINNDGQSERKDLNGLINSLEDFCNYEGIDYTPFKSLKIYKDVILNTLAHNDVESPLYQQEMKAVLEAVSQLNTIKRGRLVIGSSKDLTFQLTGADGSNIIVSLRTRESFVLVEEEGEPIRLSNFGKCEVRSVNRGTGWVSEEQGYNDIKSLIDFYKQQMAVTDSFDLLDLLDYRGNTLRAKLIPPAAPVAPAVE